MASRKACAEKRLEGRIGNCARQKKELVMVTAAIYGMNGRTDAIGHFQVIKYIIFSLF